MKLEKDVIVNRINRSEEKRTAYVVLADQYERMYNLDAGFKTDRQQALEEGREQVTLSTPYNTVNLSERLLSDKPRISVLSVDNVDLEAQENQGIVERWLNAFWTRANRDRQRNIVADARRYLLTLGRVGIDIRWVKEALPKLRRDTMLPIAVRALDPRDIGYFHNGLYTEWIYHVYTISILEAIRKYPELKNAPKESRLAGYVEQVDKKTGSGEDLEVVLTDFWYISEDDGSVWNAILVEDEFAKVPMKTDYPDLPIFMAAGDRGLTPGDEYDGLSVLHPIKGLWEYQCRLVSQMGTGLLWHFWPPITIETPDGAPEDLEIGPGITQTVAEGTRVTIHSINPNVPLADTMFQYLDASVQQSTYPNSMYGQEPGSLQAGYGISLLNDAASGRIKNFAESLEMALSYCNSFILALVQTFAGPEGVRISYYDEQNKEKMALTVTPEIIDGNLENEVKIRPRLPSDDQARLTLGLRMVSEGVISKRTFWDKYLDVQAPDDEDRRLLLEQALASEAMTIWQYREILAERYGVEGMLSRLYNTEFMPDPGEGYRWVQAEPLGPVRMEYIGPSRSPDMEAGDMPPMGDPLMGDMPPLPPEGLQPEAIQGPMGGNLIAPAMAGMIEPEMMGLPPDADPLLTAEMLGQPLPRGDELDLLAGGPPPGAF